MWRNKNDNPYYVHKANTKWNYGFRSVLKPVWMP